MAAESHGSEHLPSLAYGELRARGWRGRLALLGPAFVASIAYLDPGNFATNIAGGSKYGYLLLWVLVAANLMAMLVQLLSAKVGIATGRSLPELCREHFPQPVNFGLWIQAELVAMATDLAEFVGAAIALNLLFGVPLLPAGLITAVVTFGVLALHNRGHRRYELTIMAFLAAIGDVLVGGLTVTRGLLVAMLVLAVPTVVGHVMAILSSTKLRAAA